MSGTQNSADMSLYREDRSGLSLSASTPTEARSASLLTRRRISKRLISGLGRWSPPNLYRKLGISSQTQLLSPCLKNLIWAKLDTCETRRSYCCNARGFP
jgi:hypothetical protein